MKIRVMRTAEIDPITGKTVYDEVKKLKVREKKEKILNDGAETEAKKIIDEVNEKAITQTAEEKLWILFKILTGNEYTYDMNFITKPHATRVWRLNYDEDYKYKDFHMTAPQEDWRCLLLVKKGICIEFTLTFENLCVRLGIPCIKVDGLTTLEHAWNAVLIEGKIRFIDTSYTKIDKKVKEGKEPIYKYFLKDYETSKEWGRSYKDSFQTIMKRLEELQKNMAKMGMLKTRADIIPKVSFNIPSGIIPQSGLEKKLSFNEDEETRINLNKTYTYTRHRRR